MSGSRRSNMASRSTGKRKSTLCRWLTLSMIIIASASGIYLWYFTDILLVKDIELHVSGNLPVDSLTMVKERYIGCNIFTIPLDKLKIGLMECRDVAEVIFKRRMPHRIDCYLREREPVAAVLCGGIKEVDENGVVLSKAISNYDVDLPLITGVNSLEDEGGRAQIQRALDVLSLLKSCGFSPAHQLSEINVDNGEVLLVWLEAGSVIRLGDSNYEERIKKLKNVYDVLERQNTFPRLIDLRFSRQVVIR